MQPDFNGAGGARLEHRRIAVIQNKLPGTHKSDKSPVGIVTIGATHHCQTRKMMIFEDETESGTFILLNFWALLFSDYFSRKLSQTLKWAR
jgi:hypothetical protein